jgi:hypothetical protein
MADFHRTLRDLFAADWSLPDPPRWNGSVVRVLHTHPDILELTRFAFRATARRQLECGLFWYGTSGEVDSTVQGIVIPAQINSWGHYELPERAVDELSEATRPRRWFNLAQVHTHPSRWVGHSPYDDRYANSRNALSLVFPSYGRVRPQWPASIGVHEFLEGRWQRLADEKVPLRIAFDSTLPIPDILDLRPRDVR